MDFYAISMLLDVTMFSSVRSLHWCVVRPSFSTWETHIGFKINFGCYQIIYHVPRFWIAFPT